VTWRTTTHTPARVCDRKLESVPIHTTQSCARSVDEQNWKLRNLRAKLEMHDILTPVVHDCSGLMHYNACSRPSLKSKTGERAHTYNIKLWWKCRWTRLKIEKSTGKTRNAWHFDSCPWLQWLHALHRMLQQDSAIKNLRACAYIQNKAVLEVSL